MGAISLCVDCNPIVFRCKSSSGVEGNRGKTVMLGLVSLPVGAVVYPAHLLARLQQVEDPRSAAAFLLGLWVAAFDLGLDLCVYVQSLFVRGVAALIRDKVDKTERDMRDTGHRGTWCCFRVQPCLFWRVQQVHCQLCDHGQFHIRPGDLCLVTWCTKTIWHSVRLEFNITGFSQRQSICLL